MHQALSKAPEFTAHLLCSSAKGVWIKNNVLNQRCSAREHRKRLRLPVKGICWAPTGKKKPIPPGHPDIAFRQAHVPASTLSLAGANNTAQTWGHSLLPRAQAPCLSGSPLCLASGKEKAKVCLCVCSPSHLLSFSTLPSCIFSFSSFLHDASLPAGLPPYVQGGLCGLRVLRDTKGAQAHFATACCLVSEMPGKVGIQECIHNLFKDKTDTRFGDIIGLFWAYNEINFLICCITW